MAATKVKLKQKGKDIERSFVLSQANAILNLKNTQWELSDDKYEFLDGEISRVKKSVKKTDKKTK